MERSKSRGARARRDPLALAHSETLRAFEKMVSGQLKSVLGAQGMRSLQIDSAIATSVRGGVVVHAPVRFRGRLTFDRLVRESPFIGVLATTVPLVDPVTRTTLHLGAYAVRMRAIARNQAVFDLHATQGKPALSTIAQQKDAPEDVPGREPLIDVEVSHGGGDTLLPPGISRVCFSYGNWKMCSWIEWK